MAVRDIIDIDFVKNIYALGVNLTLDDGSPFPDILFEQAIDSAITTVESELGIRIDPFVVKGERHDVITQHKEAFYPWTLDHKPVRSISNISIKLGSYDAATLPVDWAVITSPQAGQVNLIPVATSASAFYFKSGVSLFGSDLYAPYRNVPSYFSVDYEAGFYFEEGTATILAGETSVVVDLPSSTSGDRLYYKLTVLDDGGSPSTPKVSAGGTDSFTIRVGQAPAADMSISWVAHSVDPLLLKAIGMIAAITPLDVAGDLIAGAGIANFSVGVDGLSQSIGTTASATSAGYGARIISFQNQLKSLMTQLRAKYRMINTFSV